MFSKLLISKIIIVLIASYFIFTAVDYSGKEYIVNGYTGQMSCFSEDSITIYIHPKENYEKAHFELFDIAGNRRDKQISEVTKHVPNTELPWSHGYNYPATFKYVPPRQLESGIYLWEKKIPFVVKNRKPADIVVVYPFNSINLNSNAGGKSFYPYNSSDAIASDTISFKRAFTTGIDQFVKDFFLWIKTQPFTINYIADIDLDESGSFDYAKILIIAGTSNTWTRKSRKNFDNYISAGGNALIFSANSMYWSSRYNREKDKLITYKYCQDDPYIEDPTCQWTKKGYSAQNSIVASYDFGGFPSQSPHNFGGYKIMNNNSPIFKGVNLKKHDTLKINNRFVDGMAIEFTNYPSVEEIVIKDPYYLDCFKKELIGVSLANQGGTIMNGTFIAVQKTKSSGVIINTSSSDWCSDNGIGGADSIAIQKITLNMITLLLNGKSVFSPR